MNDLLTENEIVQLTGAKRPSLQTEILDKSGIFYIVRKDRSLSVTWYSIHHPRITKAVASDTPDFDAISKTG